MMAVENELIIKASSDAVKKSVWKYLWGASYTLAIVIFILCYLRYFIQNKLESVSRFGLESLKPIFEVSSFPEIIIFVMFIVSIFYGPIFLFGFFDCVFSLVQALLIRKKLPVVFTFTQTGFINRLSKKEYKWVEFDAFNIEKYGWSFQKNKKSKASVFFYSSYISDDDFQFISSYIEKNIPEKRKYEMLNDGIKFVARSKHTPLRKRAYIFLICGILWLTIFFVILNKGHSIYASKMIFIVGAVGFIFIFALYLYEMFRFKSR